MIAWRYEYEKWSEKLVTWFIWHLPRRLIYWATIRLFAHATTIPDWRETGPAAFEKEYPDTIDLWTALKRWNPNRGGG